VRARELEFGNLFSYDGQSPWRVVDIQSYSNGDVLVWANHPHNPGITAVFTVKPDVEFDLVEE
jgi:hypothetical protein